MKLILTATCPTSARPATSSRSRTATAATTCSRAGWPSWPPAARRSRSTRSAGPASPARSATSTTPGGRRRSSGSLDRHGQGEGRGRLGPAVRLGHRRRRRRRRPGRRRPGARPAGGRGARPDQDRRQAPGHGAPAPGGHHRGGCRGGRRLTPVVTLCEGRVHGSSDPCPAPFRCVRHAREPANVAPVSSRVVRGCLAVAERICGRAVWRPRRERDTPKARSLRRVATPMLSTPRIYCAELRKCH